jgi:hypothetical protein
MGAFMLATEFDLAAEFGIPELQRRTVYASAFMALRRLWTVETVTSTGRHPAARTRPHSAALTSSKRCRARSHSQRFSRRPIREVDTAISLIMLTVGGRPFDERQK